jgi:hypothetical protein
MSQERNEKIVKYLKKVGQSNANGIAQNALGMTKASGGLRKLLESMLSSGEIEADNSGRYTEYKAPSSRGGSIGKSKSKSKSVSKKSSSKKSSSKKSKSASKKSSGVEARKIGKTKQPAIKVEILKGYSAKGLKDGSVEISGPRNQTATLADGEHLIVINGNFSYGASTPPEVIAAISDYAKANGMATFTVKDMKTNSVIGTSKDIDLDESRILCLEIAKHNKAA